MRIQTLLTTVSKRFGDKPALIFGDAPTSFVELMAAVARLARALQRQGIVKGDKVAIYLPNCPEYVYGYLATFCLGAVVVPLDYMLKHDELVSCLGHSESKILIAKNKDEVDFSRIQKETPSLKTIVLCDDASSEFISYSDFLEGVSGELPVVEISDSDPSLIMYTSGTTGNPKGVLLNYKHLEGSPKAMHHFVDLTEKDVKLCAIPLSHIAGLIYIQNCISFGISLVVMERFNPYEFLRNIMQYRITCFHIVPAMYTALLSLKQIEKFDLSSLRWVVVFGAPSSPDILQRFQKFCPNAQLLNGWGMTETCPPNTVTPLGSNRIESVGKPSPDCEIKIRDEKDRDVPIGEVGEVVIRGWIITDGYYKDPQTTAELKKDGWFHTGDLGRFDPEGFLYIVGRKKEMIKVGGQIVYAPEVESVLYKHDAVAEVAVIGVPDKLRGESVKAFVVLKSESGVTAEDLRFFAKEHLAHFKVPHSVELKESLPKNRVGKIDKEALKQAVALKS